MNYGLLSLLPDLPQSHGYFVDRQNRILFFLRKQGPGYVIDFDTALKLSELRHREGNGLLANLFGILTLTISFVFYWFLFSTLGHEPEKLVPAFLLSLITAAALSTWRTQYRFQKHALPILEANDQVQCPRPKVYGLSNLNLRTTLGIFAFVLMFLVLVGLGGTLLYVGIIENNSLPIALSLILVGLMLLGLFALLVWQYATEPSKEEIWFYEPTENEIKTYGLYSPSDYIGKRTESYKQIISKTLFGTLVGALFICVVTASLYAVFYRTPITVEDLTRRFESIAFGPTEIEIDGIQKWQKPVTIHITEAADPNLSDAIREQLHAFAKAADIPITFSSNSSQESEITIKFSPDARQYNNRDLVLGRLPTKLGTNGLDHSQVTIFEGSIKRDKQKPSPQWNERQLSITTVFLVFGMHGRYEFGAPRYEHHIFELVRVPLVLVAMYYDPRIKNGMTKEQVMPIVREMSQEIIEADSFKAWLKQSRKRSSQF